MEAAAAFGGGIDVLVNNAAVRRETAFAAMEYREWREVMAVILDGAFLCARAALPHLRAAGAGAVVNIGGVVGAYGLAGAGACGGGEVGACGAHARIGA